MVATDIDTKSTSTWCVFISDDHEHDAYDTGGGSLPRGLEPARLHTTHALVLRIKVSG